MNLLDENIRQDQGEQLRKWRVHFRILVRDLAKPGIQDPDTIPLLHHAKFPTLFTHDQDYFDRTLIHRAYCLVWLDVYDGDAALFIRRFLRHPAFSTQAQRLGRVVHVHKSALQYWEVGKANQTSADWQSS